MLKFLTIKLKLTEIPRTLRRLQLNYHFHVMDSIWISPGLCIHSCFISDFAHIFLLIRSSTQLYPLRAVWPNFILKVLDTFGNCQNPLCIPTYAYNYKSVKKWADGHRSFKRIMKEVTPFFHKCVCAPIKGSRPDVLLIFEWESTSFSKTTLFQRGPFLNLKKTQKLSNNYFE